LYVACKDKDHLQDEDAYCLWYILDRDIEAPQGAIFFAPSRTSVSSFAWEEHFETICSRYYYAGSQSRGMLQMLSSCFCAVCMLPFRSMSLS
jgi:hypothetical protein